MPTLTIVKDLEVFENRARQLQARGPSLAIQEFDLHAAPEQFNEGVVVARADGTTHRRQEAGAVRSVASHAGRRIQCPTAMA